MLNPDLLKRLDAIHAGTAGNPAFPKPPVDMDVFKTAVQTYVRYALAGTGGAPGPWTTVALPGPKTATISNLTPGATYLFQVRAFGRLGFTNWSDSVSFICA